MTIAIVCSIVLLAAVLLISSYLFTRESTSQHTSALDYVVAQALGIPLESAREFIAISERFGNADISGWALANALRQLVSDQDNNIEFEACLHQITGAIAAANIEDDLSAPPQPTGDALFDRYAEFVDTKVNAADYQNIDTFKEAGFVPEIVLGRWEEDFGADPRYWELRYVACNKQDGEEVGFLEEARERGITSANTLMLLYRERREELRQQEKIDRESHIYPYTAEEAAELRVLADEAIAVGENEAWPYYMRALYWFENGQLQQGLADLRAGNLQPVNICPVAYPSGLIRRGLLEPVPAGSAVVGGAFLIGPDLKANRLSSLSILMKKALAACLDEADAAEKVDVMETWHQFACRMVESGEADWMLHMVAMILCGVIRDAALQDPLIATSDAQRETLGRLLGAKENMKASFRGRGSEFDVMTAILTLALAGKGRGGCLAMYLDASVDQRLLSTEVKPMFREISEVHYPQLEMTDDLLKYENVTIEELQERRDKQMALAEQDNENEDAGD